MINIPNSLTEIKESTFQNCSGLTSLTISDNIRLIGIKAFSGCSGLRIINLGSGIEEIGCDAFMGCTGLKVINISNLSGWCKINYFGVPNPNNNPNIISEYHPPLEYANRLYLNNEEITNLVIPPTVTTIATYAFSYCKYITSISIPNTVSSIERCFDYCSGIQDVYSCAESVPSTISSAFNESYVNYAKLHVPASSVSAYSSAAPWSGFGTIDAITSEDITIGDLGIGTFCGSNPLDLSGTEDVKAYVVSSYESATGQVTLTRTYYIPPFTGVVVKGNKGVYTIPAGVGQPVYPNMMKGVTTNTALNKVNGDYTNYVLANKGGNLGFYAVSDGSTLGAGKAYLPLPTADLPTAAREFTLIFDDGETTEIMKVASQEKASQGYYDLQGRRVANPTSGLYIVNGKKVIIK